MSSTLAGLKMISTKKKHKKLDENWTEIKPVVEEGMKFTAKYIGMTLVDSPKGEEMAATAIKRIVTTNKVGGKDAALVLLTVSTKGIHVKDISSDEILFDIDITRISFCTADKVFGKVFGYVAQNTVTEAFECHGYMLGSRKEAQNLTLTVAHSFRVAYNVSKKDDDINTSNDFISTDFDGSSQSSLNDNKTISGIYRSIADSRYKRLSDSFEGPESHSTGDATTDNFTINKTSSAEEIEIDALDKVVMKPTSHVLKEPSEKMISLEPPPSSKGKLSSRQRTAPTANLIDVFQQFEIPISNQETQQESHDLERDFAELAMSRTK